MLLLFGMLVDEVIGVAAEEELRTPRTSVSDANIRRVDVIDNGVPADVAGVMQSSFTVDDDPPNCCERERPIEHAEPSMRGKLAFCDRSRVLYLVGCCPFAGRVSFRIERERFESKEIAADFLREFDLSTNRRSKTTREKQQLDLFLRRSPSPTVSALSSICRISGLKCSTAEMFGVATRSKSKEDSDLSMLLMILIFNGSSYLKFSR